MFDANITIIVIGLLLVMVFAVIHVAVALGVTAMAGLFLVFKGDIPLLTFMVGSTGYEAIRAYVFAVVPLFMLMGEFISRSGAAADLYNSINRNLSRIPGRLAHATVLGNALFAFVTGTSLASATAFTSISFPEMKKHGYHPGFALGSIAGSACLGMLIPPSLFMVVWGILTEQSIGILFIAGVIQGFLLTGLMLVYIFGVSVVSPSLVGMGADRTALPDDEESADDDKQTGSNFISFIGLFGVIFGVLGGIWVGWFTPTEGAAIGAILGLILGVVKGMRWPEIIDAVLAVAKTSVPIMVLLFAAQLYARVLALAGVGTAVQNFFIGTGLEPRQILTVMVIIWFVMGMLIDSVSIMLLTVPIFAPLAVALGYDQVAFALIGILAIEAGILTPPFGLLVYAVKAVSPDKNVTLMQIFIGSTPYWIMLMIVMIAIANIPEIATWLPTIAM